VEERARKESFSHLAGNIMKRILTPLLGLIVMVVATTVTYAQTSSPSNSQERAANPNRQYYSPYQSGTIVGTISGPYGSVLFVELEDKTKLRFHHPGTTVNRGDRILVFQRNGEYFLVESATPE
jgi:hypothetical protein